MKNTWILIADASVARLFTGTANFEGMTLRKEISHPKSRAKDQELNTDKSGRAFKGDSRRTTMDPASDAHELEADHFAREVAGMLEEELSAYPDAKLTLVSAPQFLGLLRKHLSDQTAARVYESLDRNYGYMDAQEIGRALRHALRGAI